ncbi:MAG: TIGR03032 family protein [Pleurocapsa sp. MO_226.B13]|nr:TIGR03032 family protein [Pleurocapsa sp. MO_226.B13]
MNPTNTDDRLEIMGSRQFNSWLGEQQISLAFTTYQAGKIFLIGLQPDGRLSIFERTFNRSMGLWATSQTLWMSSLYQLWRLENSLSDRQVYQGYDRLYVPQIGYTTGDLDIHDLAIDREGKIIFVNTLFSCLATVSQKHSFIPLWQPPFISKLAAEDRCHLNGLAMENGQPRYVTAVGQTDVADGWRDRRRDGGCIIDVNSNEVIVSGLSMPHSPRVYQNRLWVLNSGTGYLGTVDLNSQKFEPLTFCPGYLRGLAFINNFAIVGLSQPRNKTFSGLPLDDNLLAKNAEARCGLMVIDLNSGDIVHWLRITGIIKELYDVAVLPGVRRPMALGFKSEEICRTITIG